MEHIKVLRKELKLTQKEFAEKIHISRSNLAGIENGSVNLSERVANDICREFNVNLEWLKTGKGAIFKEVDSPEELEEFLAHLLMEEDDLMKETILTLSKLSKEEFNIVAKMISSLKK
ncbi:helix-turn-helix domain-containing protein [Clostridium sardiniense]|uniref:helix-turn-helix domain-containing protein n=1 Tax=Clostridium sardiniense TaxID=29369 RepID=UPI00195E1EF1|nr:helix-turn-helix transcriptional regulator [Clostridium sardiniense]MBM7836460.1 transcriptional regulator with XRE-family HTH domain [Clostridium sardiniense]